jgi:hypothetical protein
VWERVEWCKREMGRKRRASLFDEKTGEGRDRDGLRGLRESRKFFCDCAFSRLEKKKSPRR